MRLITSETRSFLSSRLQGSRGTIDVVPTMAELTIYTASRSLQGKEVRSRFDSSFADLYHDLDMGFTPINFMLPWAPLPQNRRRDAAREKMAATYAEIVRARRKAIEEGTEEAGQHEEDMIWNLMGCKYKDGTPLADHEIAHMMIALLMAGQHSSSSTSSWILLRLATRPDIQEELYAEMEEVLGVEEVEGEDGRKKRVLGELTHEKLGMLRLNAQVVKETLRMHAPIHSILRKVRSSSFILFRTFNHPSLHFRSPSATAIDNANAEMLRNRSPPPSKSLPPRPARTKTASTTSRTRTSSSLPPASLRNPPTTSRSRTSGSRIAGTRCLRTSATGMRRTVLCRMRRTREGRGLRRRRRREINTRPCAP